MARAAVTDLSEEQQEVLDELLRFSSSVVPVALLTGPAGSGKTTLLRAFLDALPDDRQVRLLAPTGRAAHVLSDHTGREATTIHRFLYNLERIVDAESTGRSAAETSSRSSGRTSAEISSHTARRRPTGNDPGLRFEFSSGYNADADDTLYVIDEASMLADREQAGPMLSFGSGKLLTDLIAFVESGANERQILFTGDPYQLPPVGEELSPALSLRYLRDEFGLRANEAALTEIVRQRAESGIFSHASRLRRQIDSRRFERIGFSSGPDIGFVAPEEFAESYMDEVRQNSYDDVIAITFTNRLARSINEEIRARRYGTIREHAHEHGAGTFRGRRTGQEAPALGLQPGDRLVIIHNNYLHKLFNGELQEVADVGSVVRELGAPGGSLRFREVELSSDAAQSGRSTGNGEESGRGTGSGEEKGGSTSSGEEKGGQANARRSVLLIENLLYSGKGGLTPQQQRALWDDAGKRLHPRVREAFERAEVGQVLEHYLQKGDPSHRNILRSALQKAFIRLDLPLEEIARLPIIRPGGVRGGSAATVIRRIEQSVFRRLLRADPYYNALRAKFGYAITCHKAQGGEWETAFVAIPGRSPMDEETQARWTYTAITRARERLYLLE